LLFSAFMSEQVIRQRSRGFICTNAHPIGCATVVDRQIRAISESPLKEASGPKRALIIGSSTGYGLASRIALAWGFEAKTLGIYFEREPSGKKTASAGYYNTAAMQARAAEDGLWAYGINGDAFSDDIKSKAADVIRRELGQVDIVIYSLASPKRTDPRSGVTYSSVLKTLGDPYTNRSIDLSTGLVGKASIEPATEEEASDTVKVMGGEDWKWWIEKLLAEDLLAPGARTLAYSYLGPELTWPMYRGGTIGAAKKDLEATAGQLSELLKKSVGGAAWVAVNKAVVTQASSAIPVLPLYISLLFKVMKAQGTHEGCIEQMRRLCLDHLADGKEPQTDAEQLIRVDDLELSADVQAQVAELWPQVTTENLNDLSDFAGFRHSFNQLFGFDVEGVDYDLPVESEVAIVNPS
jgi:enoyl-[acyl-carrier protein] reductase/trans-2-enoyl-CoA reductase (NAD+)